MKLKITIAAILIVFGLSAWVSCSNDHNKKVSIQDKISYNYDIRPILSDKCYPCHGPDANKRKADFRLDIKDSAYAPLKETIGAFAIVPGKPEESELINRISSTDPSYQMPEPESHLGLLSEREIQLFTAWIKQGAKFEKHWAFVKPEKAKLPEVSDMAWPKNEIDYFTLAKMDEQRLVHNEEAAKELLLKKITLDITGLLPTIKEMDDYAADKSSDAYEKVVDKLLNTPQYGEKMAVHWLGCVQVCR